MDTPEVVPGTTDDPAPGVDASTSGAAILLVILAGGFQMNQKGSRR